MSTTAVRPSGGAPSPRTTTRARLARRRTVGLVVLLAVLVAAVAASVAFGSRVVSLGDVVTGLTDPSSTDIASIAVRERLPRTVLGIVVGAALGLAGAVMQAITRNPLADPGILGVTTGASLAVVCGIAFLGISSPGQFVWFAFAGAALTAVGVYAIGSLGRGGASPLKLALAGAATTAALSALVSAVLLPRVEMLTTFRFWQIGGLSGADPAAMTQLAPLALVATAACLLSAPGLNALALGDDLATGLGAHVGWVRIVSAAGAVMLCAVATSLAGPIAFVGLVVPNAVRAVVGPDQRWVLPYSMAAGATLLLVADVVGRVVARPTEVDVGIVTALIGAPVFIAIVRRARIPEL